MKLSPFCNCHTIHLLPMVLLQCLFTFSLASLSTMICSSCSLEFSITPSLSICSCTLLQMPMRQVNLSQTKPLIISNGIPDQSMSSSASDSSANSAVIIYIALLFHSNVFPLWQSRWRSLSDGPGPSLEMKSFISWLVTDKCSPKSISSSYFKVFTKNAHNFSC